MGLPLVACTVGAADAPSVASTASALVGDETLIRADADSLALAPDGKGGALALWAVNEPGKAAIVRGAFLEDSGKMRAAPFTVLTAASTTDAFIHMDLAAGEGGYLLVLAHSGAGGAYPAVLAIDAAGVADPAGLIDVGDASDGTVAPRAAFDGQKFVMTWTFHEPAAARGFEVRAARVDVGRGPAVHPFALPGKADEESGEGLACKTGECLVLRRHFLSSSDGLYASRMKMDGAAPVALDDAPLLLRAGALARRSTATFDGTNYVVVWTDRVDESSGFSVVAARVSPSGTLLGDGVDPALGGILVGPRGNDYELDIWPALARDGQRTLVVWQQSETGDPPRHMFGGWLAADGTVTPAAPGFSVCDNAAPLFRPLAAAGHAGGVLAGYPQAGGYGVRLLTFDPALADAGADARDAAPVTPDASLPDASVTRDAATPDSAPAPTDAADVTASATNASSGGCACAATGSPRGSRALPLMGLALVAASARRRRRSRRP